MNQFFFQKLKEAENYYNHQDLINLRRIAYDVDQYFQKEYQTLIAQQFSQFGNPQSIEQLNSKITELKQISDFFKDKITFLEASLSSENKLTNEQKLQIYHLYKSGLYDQKYLAQIFATSQSNISKIIANFG